MSDQEKQSNIEHSDDEAVYVISIASQLSGMHHRLCASMTS